MIGAVIGDIAGSIYEWDNCKSKDFPFMPEKCFFTDDTVMSLAVCKAILVSGGSAEELEKNAGVWMREVGRHYPNAGYGGRFAKWLTEKRQSPYNSFGNGSAMRVSGCAFAADSLQQALLFSDAVTRVTHNHPEGMKGARAVASAAYLAKTGAAKGEIRKYIEENFYPIDFTLDEIREGYTFDETCQGSVPQAIAAFLESENFEDSIRCAISVGGDSDTIAAITGSIAEAYYGAPEELRIRAIGFLDGRLKDILHEFEDVYPPKIEE